jgi:hypothetical protein
MKIQGDVVIQFLKDLRFQAQGIIDTVRSGDDGFEESCKSQIADMLKAMDIFRVEKLTPLTPLKKPTGKAYQIGLPMVDDQHGFSISDNVAIYKHRLYNYLKRRLQELDLLNIPTNHLDVHIEETLLCGSPYEKDAYSKEWFYSSQAVLNDLVQEIKSEREKTPQLALFKTNVNGPMYIDNSLTSRFNPTKKNYNENL